MKKRLSKAILMANIIATIVLTLVPNASAASNPYPEKHTIMGFPLVNCTWYAWQQVYDNTGVALPNFGNAINWYSGAQNYGYATGTVAKANSVAVWRTTNGYGHVGWVVSVSGSKMKVNEGGMTNSTGTAAANGTGIVTGASYNSTVGEAKFNGSSTILVGFIYPTETVTTNVTVLPTQSGKTNTYTENNATLYGTVNKNTSAAVQMLGMRIAKQGSDYSTGKTYKYTPNGGNYVGSSYINLTFDVKDEVGYTLTHATTYKYQIYAQVNGNEYWSVEKVFTTTGSHTFGGWIVTNAATCTAAGTKTRVCTSCGYSENQTVSATGHSYSGNWTVDTAATCTTSGSKSHHCTQCGSKTDITTISATGHNWSAWTTTTNPTCTTTGAQTRTCLNCRKTESQNINATGHSYSGSWTIDTAATCTAAGSKSHHCTKCNSKTDITTISATGHNWGSWQTVIEATTNNDGKQQRKCQNQNCSATEVKTIVKLSEDGHTHNFGEWIVTTPATCTKDGQMASSCTICGATQTQTLSATGHDFGEWYSAKEPTTENEGLEERSCKTCLLTEQRVLEKLSAPDVSTDEQVSAPETSLDKDIETATDVSISKETQKNNDRNILLLMLPIAAVVLSGAIALTVIIVRKFKNR